MALGNWRCLFPRHQCGWYTHSEGPGEAGCSALDAFARHVSAQTLYLVTNGGSATSSVVGASNDVMSCHALPWLGALADSVELTTSHNVPKTHVLSFVRAAAGYAG